MKASRESFWGFVLFLMTGAVIKMGISFLGSHSIPSKNSSQTADFSSTKEAPTSSASAQVAEKSGSLQSFRQKKNQQNADPVVVFRALPRPAAAPPFRVPQLKQLLRLNLSEVSGDWFLVKDLQASLVRPQNENEIFGQVHQMTIVKSEGENSAWPVVLYSQRQQVYGLVTGNISLQMTSQNLARLIELFHQKPFYESPETGFYYFKADSLDQLSKWLEKVRHVEHKDLNVEVLQGVYARQ